VSSGGLAAGSRPLALLVAGTLFMELLDGTVISTAAPSMARSFGVRSADIGIAITTYLLVVAVLIPLSGWLADRIGARVLLVTAIAVFTVASGLCAISTGLLELTLFRILQGIGGAMMVPVGRLVVMRGTRKSEVIAAVAYLTWPALVAPVIAPALGGALTTYASWRWIFLINVPLGIAGLLLALRLVPNWRAETRRRLDWIGLVTSTAGLAAFVYGVSLLGQVHIPTVQVLVFLAASVVLLAIAVWHLLRTNTPLVDLHPLTIRTFRASQSGGGLYRMAVLAIPFLLPLMFQDDFGWSAAKAGALVIFVFVGNLAIKPTTTPLLRRFGFRAVLVGSVGLGVLTTLACGLLYRDTPIVIIAVLLTAGGALRSIGFTAYNTITFADVGSEEMVHANTLSATVQQLASGISIAVAASALRLGDAVRALFGQAGSVHFPYAFAFVAVTLLLVPALIEAVRLPRTAGAGIGGGAGKRATNIREVRS
jgi:EmrB/QacA subfamily drug resistance transporter